MIRIITHNEVKVFQSKAAKEGICLKDTKTTTWFGAFDDDNNLCGVAGTILKNGKGRIRGVYVDPNKRGNNYGSSLMYNIIEWLCSNNACYIDQFAGKPNWWVKQGWKIKKSTDNGSWVYKTI
jgi:GNAT superfamily N-acetyltransferase